MHANDATPGEDYCFAGNFPEGHAQFIAVSDGCSGGAHTNLGSATIIRMLIKALMETYQKLLKTQKEQKPSPGLLNKIIGKDEWKPTIPTLNFMAVHTKLQKLIDGAMKVWFLRDLDMSATLLYGVFTETEGRIKVLGDGGIGIKHRDGTFTLYKFNWTGEAPFYPYFNRGERREAFIEEYGGDLGKKGAFVSRLYTNRQNNLPFPYLISTTHIDEEIGKIQTELDTWEDRIKEWEDKKPKFKGKRPFAPKEPIAPQVPIKPEKSAALIGWEARQDQKPENKSWFKKWFSKKDPMEIELETFEKDLRLYNAEMNSYTHRKRWYEKELATYNEELKRYATALEKFKAEEIEWKTMCHPFQQEIDQLAVQRNATKNALSDCRITKEIYLKKLASDQFYGTYKLGSGLKEFEITEQYSLEQGMRGVHISFSEKEMQDIECIALFTDGIHQMTGLDWKDAMKRMLSYTEEELLAHDAKPRERGFARQQLAGLLRRNFVPMDDVSVSAIHFGNEEKIAK